MRKILFVVYHDITTEARSFETLQILKKIGKVSVVTIADVIDKDIQCYISKYEEKKKFFRYLSFLSLSKYIIRKDSFDLVLLHDIPNLVGYVKKYNPNAFVICDQSELHIDRTNRNIRDVLLNLISLKYEKSFSSADLIFVPNIERLELLKKHYKILSPMEVFDNMHRIDEDYDPALCSKLYGKYFEENEKFTVVYGGGISKNRMTYELINAVEELGNAYQLIICGAAPEGLNDYKIIEEQSKIKNFTFLGFIPRDHWKYLIRMSDLTFVAFAMNNLNNINCESGKMYESLFEMKPILAYVNPPLKRLCESENVGISTNNFKKGIYDIKENYAYYVDNVTKYISKINYENRLSRIESIINEHYISASKRIHK